MARTNGSTCYTSVTWKQLADFFPEGTAIPVSRVWLQRMNFLAEPISKNTNKPLDPPEQPASFKVESFDNE